MGIGNWILGFNSMKQLIRKIIPKFIISFYHYFLSAVAAIWYRFPSSSLTVIGVTGTKGKSTTAYLLGQLLKSLGKKVGWTSTISFFDGEKEELNPIKMTMPGRFLLQKILRQMVNNGVQYAIIETSSEGILQHRQRGIDYAGAIFTNLSPEHLEAHGGYENYKRAKGQLFKQVAKKGQLGFAVVNLDDAEAGFFIEQARGARIFGFTERDWPAPPGIEQVFRFSSVSEGPGGVSFRFEGEQFTSPLLGKINVLNLVAAIVTAKMLELPLKEMIAPIRQLASIPGRLEFIRRANNDMIVVDYAHTPQSIDALYAALEVVKKKRVIHAFGPTGGGRDQDKIRLMGELVGQYADIVIVTTDDPYFEDPKKLAEPMMMGAKEEGKMEGRNLFWIADRREAIREAMRLQESGDLVVITGKGSEQKMAIGGKLIDWDDRKVVKEAIEHLT